MKAWNIWRAFEVTGDHNHSTVHHTDVVLVFGFFRSQTSLVSVYKWISFQKNKQGKLILIGLNVLEMILVKKATFVNARD